jgi:hypothetical protein
VVSFAAFNIADGTAISELHRRHRVHKVRDLPAELDCPGRCPKAAANVSNTLGTSSGRARRYAVVATMMAATACAAVVVGAGGAA